MQKEPPLRLAQVCDLELPTTLLSNWNFKQPSPAAAMMRYYYGYSRTAKETFFLLLLLS
jgi:hypothetical protein